MRLDRPVGVWLLFWPGAWGIALGAAVNPATPWWPDPSLIALFLTGAVLMRGAGCVWNDVIDKDLDAQVARTAGRPLAAGRISRQSATAFTAILCFLAFLILIQLDPLAIGFGIASLGLVGAYPLMKRVTWWPQAWLGLTFNWGVLMGFAAATGTLSLSAGLLYITGLFWTLGYDTVYACQDLEDDALAGVKSSARRLGTAKAIQGFILASYTAAALCLAVAGILTGLESAWPVFLVFCAAAVVMLVWGVRSARAVKGFDDGTMLAAFKSNAALGAFVFVHLAAAGLLAGL